jgi:hypothetical protein
MKAIVHIDQLGGDSDAAPRLANTAFKDVVDVEFFSNLGEFNILAPEKNEDVRPATLNPGRFVRALIISSASPSLKYSCSLSPLMLTKGRTAMEGCGSAEDILFFSSANLSSADFASEID